MKKVVFISAFLIGLMCIFNTEKVSAATWVQAIGINNDYYTFWFDTSYTDCENTIFTISINGADYSFKKPVLVMDNEIYNPTNNHPEWNNRFMRFICNTQIRSTTGTGSASTTQKQTQIGSFSGPDLLTLPIQYYGIPLFKTYQQASNYSLGLNYDSSDLIGGLAFDTPSIGEEYYENKIYHFEKVWNVYSRPTTRMSWNIAWIQNYDNDLYENSDYHRQVGITVKYPDYTSIANLYDSVFNEPQSFATTLEYAKSFFTYDHLYDSRLTYKETTIWVDIDDMINDYEANGENSEWANWFHLTQNIDKSEYNFTMYETLETALTASNWGQSYSYNPKGMVNIFRQYYNNDRLLLFALPFCIFEKAQMFTFNEPQNIVYNPIYIFWFDATAPDGTRSEKRNFGNPTNITSDNLVEPDDSNNNLGVSNGVPNPSEQQLASNYSSSIQDSYNNIYNNYYYNSEQNKDLLDYLMKYKDGGTEQDVQDAFGYVNTTIDSVSNVPIMLGKLFTGFFPPKVIMLFSALFIIFAVFIIVKIVRHLFL